MQYKSYTTQDFRFKQQERNIAVKLKIFLTFFIFFVFCNNPAEPPIPKSKILSASVLSGYYKTCLKGVTVDSFPITQDDSVYRFVHWWDTIVIKSDTLFLKCLYDSVKTYTGFLYNTTKDSIFLHPLGLFDSMLILDSLSTDTQVITLKGSPSEIYTEYAQVDKYLKSSNGWLYGGGFVTININKKRKDEFNSADSASGSFCRIVFK